MKEVDNPEEHIWQISYGQWDDDKYGFCLVCKAQANFSNPFGGRHRKKCQGTPTERRHASEILVMESRHEEEQKELYGRQAEEAKVEEAKKLLQDKGYQVSE